jgi:hypothetical protein
MCRRFSNKMVLRIVMEYAMDPKDDDLQANAEDCMD